MTSLGFMSMDLLWRNALAVIPLAMVVGAICRWAPCRPSTRHALWLLVLISLLAPPMLPSEHVQAAWNHLATAAKLAFNSTEPSRVAPVQPLISRVHATPAVSEAVSDRTTSVRETASPMATPAARQAPRMPQAAPPIAADPSVPRRATAGTTWRSSSINQSASNSTRVFVASPVQSEPAAAMPHVIDVVPLSDDRVLEHIAHTAGGLGHVQLTTATGNVTRDEIVLFGDRARAGSPDPGFVQSQVIAAGLWLRSVGSHTWGAIARMAEPTREWMNQLAAVRDAVAAVRPIPAAMWIGGCLVLMLVILGRSIRFHRLLRRASPAPVSVRRAVAEAAAAMELPVAPDALMVDQRVSPLVWCGRRRVLILPRDLWNDLDEVGRNAVLLHELAHLKRRDHWVCWLELFIGAVYWWHPLVWLVRHRLREEADRCCDVWVTSLLPASNSRSAYARALLATRQYLGHSQLASPAMGLGATSPRAKRFARRLTMVMTERSRPRLSMLGASLTLCVAAAAWLSAPLFACPPESESESEAKATVTVTKAKAPKAPKAPRAVIAIPAMPAPPSPPAPPDASTFERHMLERHSNPGSPAPGAFDDDADLRMRLDQMEQRLNHLTEQLHHLGVSGSAGQGAQGMGSAQGMGGGRAFAMPRVAAPSLPRGAVQLTPGEMHIAPEAMAGALARTGPDVGQTISRFYNLPAGKREALINLMSRSDVPVLISARDDGIEVHATPLQQEIFSAFVRMINPESQEQPGHGAGAAARELERAYEQAARAGSVDVRRAQEEARKALEIRRRAVEQQRSRLQERVKEMYHKAREFEGRADAMHDEADGLEGPQKDQLIAQADALYAEAGAIEAQADAMESEADVLQDELEEAIEELDAESEDDGVR
jgi:beta-lactamase regulating signal transducer with metallopeptidase domain